MTISSSKFTQLIRSAILPGVVRFADVGSANNGGFHAHQAFCRSSGRLLPRPRL